MNYLLEVHAINLYSFVDSVSDLCEKFRIDCVVTARKAITSAICDLFTFTVLLMGFVPARVRGLYTGDGLRLP